MKLTKAAVCIPAILLMGFCDACLSAQHLHFTTGFTPPVSDYFRLVLEEADKRLPDISISFEVLPAERSLKLVEAGINDGECCRIPKIIYKTYNNMVTVPVSFHSVRFSAFSKHRDIPIKHFEDLKPYSVGTVKGWRAAVNNIQRVAPVEAHIVTKPEQLFRMLQQDRIDFGVMGYMSGLKTISDLHLHDIYVIEPPLIEEKLFLLLAAKHRALVPVFTRVFNDMIKDGTTERLFKEITPKI